MTLSTPSQAPVSAAPHRPENAVALTGRSPAPGPAPAPPEPPARGRYARLPLLAGRSFIPIGIFARLPLAMLTVGALTLVTAVTGSFAVGGMSAGAVGIGSALGAPVIGALADRQGQRPVLVVAAIFNTVAVIALILAAYLVPGGQDLAAALPVLVAGFVAGASCPQVGPLARVRWMALTARGGRTANPADLDTALSYESTADELTFVLGPALVGILASLAAPWLPLALAAALTITLVPAFAVHPTHHAVVRTPARTVAGAAREKKRRASLPAGQRAGAFAAVALPVLAMVCMGTFFGSTQTSLSSFSASFATSELAGLLYAVMGLSSAAAALSVAYWPQRFTANARWLACAALMAGLALLLLLPSTALPMILVLLVLGLPVGPLMVTVFAIGGVVAPAGKLGTVMTALASGIVAGTAIGSSIAGQLAQHHGYSTAFLVPVCAATALFLLGTAAAVVLQQRNRTAAATEATAVTRA
ncbi:MFS transporter [Arthrobacter sp. UYEF36]|uniref:MFS transporter n=1 Tax=Arthrobacter sp. UYEF36 TaxID=1756366 RepID=UPI003398643B